MERPVLHLRRAIESPPVPAPTRGLGLRQYRDQRDQLEWLKLHRAAFPRSQERGRDWTTADFDREFAPGPKSGHRRLLFAELTSDEAEPRIVGSVAVALHCSESGGDAALNWLMVEPGSRRRGVGELLVRAAEACAWNAGARAIRLETLAAWSAAVALYRKLGYCPIRDRS